MKKVEENKFSVWAKQYKYSTILTLIIFILFLTVTYSKNSIYSLYINHEKVHLNYEIYAKDSLLYMHIDDVTRIFKDNVYYDKISGKIIITTFSNILKVEKTDENYVLTLDNGMYLDLEKIVANIELDSVVSNNNIYVINRTQNVGIVKYNRTEIIDCVTHNVIFHVDKGDKVRIVEQANKEISDVVDIVVTKNKKDYYGYILKSNMEVEYDKKQDTSSNNSKRVVLVKAQDKLKQSTDTNYVDMVAIDMYRLSAVNALTKLEYTNNVPEGIDVFATINNGYLSSNYDPEITTRMLNSQSNREEIIQFIAKSVEDMQGICIDFVNLKVSDNENFTQFIKEVAAVMHINNKKIIVNVQNTQYINVYEIAKVVDYIVIEPYFARTTSSKTSGPISSLIYVENIVQDILNMDIDSTKVILEIPAYSILWTERKGTVIDAEKLSMQMIQEYITLNDVQEVLDKTNGQNYINYTKGITTYKMWLEDEYSVEEKAKFIKEYDLAGISVYKSGMELKSIYKNIFSNLEELD